MPKSKSCSTRLVKAILLNNKEELYKLIVKEGVNVNACCNCGTVGFLLPLDIAVRKRNYEVVRQLISLGANVDQNNNLLFIQAVQNRDNEMVRVLSEYGVLLEFNADLMDKMSCEMMKVCGVMADFQSMMRSFKKNNQAVLSKNFRYVVRDEWELIIRYLEHTLNGLVASPFGTDKQKFFQFISLLNKLVFELDGRKEIAKDIMPRWSLVIGRTLLASELLQDCGLTQEDRYIEVLSHLSSALKCYPEARELSRCCYRALRAGNTEMQNDLHQQDEGGQEARLKVYSRKYQRLFTNEEYLDFIPAHSSHSALFLELFEPFRRVYFGQDVKAMKTMAKVFGKYEDRSGELFWLAKTAKEGDLEAKNLLKKILFNRLDGKKISFNNIELCELFVRLMQDALNKSRQNVSDEECQKLLRNAYEYAIIVRRVFCQNLSEQPKFGSNFFKRKISKIFTSIKEEALDLEIFSPNVIEYIFSPMELKSDADLRLPKGLSDHLFDQQTFDMFVERMCQEKAKTSVNKARGNQTIFRKA